MTTPAEETIDFARLPASEQTAVAERLLKIKESGWKPFWCPDPNCNGMPHPLLDANGDEQFVATDETAGPEGEPVSGIIWETPDGELFLPDYEHGMDLPGPDDTEFGRMIYDPRWSHNHARVDQRLPPWIEEWTLFIMSGRGAGKTRTGIEFVTLCARKGLDGAIVGRRGNELTNTHVAEIVKYAHPEFVPEYFASKDILVWPNGAITYLFSAERPENIRSVNLSYVWFDEAAWMDEIEAAWDNAEFATRVKSPGNPIHKLITSTPTGGQWVQEMEDNEDVIVRRVSTYANKANLDSGFLAKLRKKHEGTRKGRQEIHGEVLRDVEGALWDDEMIHSHRYDDASKFAEFLETLDDCVVAVDPAGSKGKRSDETGIIAAGAHHMDENNNRLYQSKFFVLGRATIKGTPTEWAANTYRLARLVNARRIVAEKNFGGDMVKQVLVDYAKSRMKDGHPEEVTDAQGDPFKIEVRHAVLSKETRAEGTVGRYEQGLVEHLPNPTVFGDLSELEKQQVTWIPKSRGGKHPSPNDIDALVWAIRDLDTTVMYKATTGSRDVLKKLKVRGGQMAAGF